MLERAVELGYGIHRVLLLEEIDESKAAALLRVAVFGEVDALDASCNGMCDALGHERMRRQNIASQTHQI